MKKLKINFFIKIPPLRGLNIMATYKEIQNDIKERYGKSIKTCWIAHVKELNGLHLNSAPNRQSADVRKYECPDNVRAYIEESMRRFGML